MNSTRTPRDSPRMTSYMSNPLSLGITTSVITS